MKLGIFGRHDPDLAGKGHSCKHRWMVLQPGGALVGSPSLIWGDGYLPTSFNPACPAKTMRIGDRSTCGVSGPVGDMPWEQDDLDVDWLDPEQVEDL